MRHIEVSFATEINEQHEMLIALLDQVDYDGFEESEINLKAFIKESLFDQTVLDEIASSMNCAYELKFIEEENWNANWESSFDPILLLHPKTNNPFAFIRASFHEPSTQAVHDLIITPKMSFGTGHHATTFQMMEQMSMIDFSRLQVIDFGTGTGLLAILAEKMGANSIDAIDNDDWSISNAIENIEANQCSIIKIIKADSCQSESVSKADIILANINLNIILANLDNIINCGKSGTTVLFSGILVEDEEQICLSLRSKSLNINSISSKNNWLLINCSII
jgi:ribosomal protein L11 methyltransferase